MRYKILLFTFSFFTLLSLHAQNTTKVFAITGDNNNANNPFLWTNISEVDAKSGKVLRPLYTHLRTAFDFYDGNTKAKRFGSSWQNNQKSPAPQMPASYIVAAAAYDVRHHRMFITPMQQPELRWINLDDKGDALKIYTVPIPLSAALVASEGAQITRMVIAADGYGYALTNDANHLIRFSTGRKVVAEDLGALQDAADNGAVSVHVKNTSFGGDMIADAAGGLYLISAYHAVFKIDITAKSALYIGKIKNLPEGFTTNGAAVDEEGKLVVSTAGPTGGYFSVDMNSWEASKISGDNKTDGVSDLASSNFAFQKKSALVPVVVAATMQPLSNITVYPNPVTQSVVRLNFANKETGRYMIQLVDLSGRLAMQTPFTLASRNQVTEMKMPAKFAKGVYMVKVVNAAGQNIYTNRILVN